MAKKSYMTPFYLLKIVFPKFDPLTVTGMALRYGPARLDLNESGIIEKPLKRTWTAICFWFFNFTLEYFKRLQSSEPLHAKLNPTSCLLGLWFAYLQAAILSIFNLIKYHASRNLFAFFPIGWFIRFGRFCRLSRKWGDQMQTIFYCTVYPNLVSVNQYNNPDILLKNLNEWLVD